MYFSNGGNGNDWVAWYKTNQMLDKMWDIPVTKEDILAGREPRRIYFDFVSDSRVAKLIFVATQSDLEGLNE